MNGRSLRRQELYPSYPFIIGGSNNPGGSVFSSLANIVSGPILFGGDTPGNLDITLLGMATLAQIGNIAVAVPSPTLGAGSTAGVISPSVGGTNTTVAQVGQPFTFKSSVKLGPAPAGSCTPATYLTPPSATWTIKGPGGTRVKTGSATGFVQPDFSFSFEWDTTGNVPAMGQYSVQVNYASNATDPSSGCWITFNGTSATVKLSVYGASPQ